MSFKHDSAIYKALKITCLVALIATTGCASKTKFKCQDGMGGSCLSLREAARLVETGEVGSDRTYAQYAAHQKAKFKKNKKQKRTKQQGTNGFYPARVPTFPMQTLNNPALRVPEQSIQVWVAPYQADGIYYQASYINVLVKKGHWLKPVVDGVSQ